MTAGMMRRAEQNQDSVLGKMSTTYRVGKLFHKEVFRRSKLFVRKILNNLTRNITKMRISK